MGRFEVTGGSGMTKQEEEYLLRMFDEALTGKTYCNARAS